MLRIHAIIIDPYKLPFRLSFHSFKLELVLDQSNCRWLYPKAIQLIHPYSEHCFWSLDLEIIIPLHLTIELVSCFYNLLPLVEYRCSRQILCGPPDPLLDFIWQRPSYSINLWAFSRIHNAFGKLYRLLSQPCSAFELELITSKRFWYRILRCPDGLNLYLP